MAIILLGIGQLFMLISLLTDTKHYYPSVQKNDVAVEHTSYRS